jgi:hypothetical protein
MSVCIVSHGPDAPRARARTRMRRRRRCTRRGGQSRSGCGPGSSGTAYRSVSHAHSCGKPAARAGLDWAVCVRKSASRAYADARTVFGELLMVQPCRGACSCRRLGCWRHRRRVVRPGCPWMRGRCGVHFLLGHDHHHGRRRHYGRVGDLDPSPRRPGPTLGLVAAVQLRLVRGHKGIALASPCRAGGCTGRCGGGGGRLGWVGWAGWVGRRVRRRAPDRDMGCACATDHQQGRRGRGRPKRRR